MQVASAYLKNGGKLALENEYTERIREFIKGEWKLKLSVIKSPCPFIASFSHFPWENET